MIVALLAVAVAATVGILGMLEDGTLRPLAGPLAGPVEDLEVVGAADHDPLANPHEERPELIDRAIDADDDTSWQTEGYERADLIPPDKDGVGLWLDLGERHQITRLELDLVLDGTSFEVYVGDQRPDPSERPDEWGRRVAQVDGADDRVDLRPDDAQGRFVLVWFTQLAQEDDGMHRGHVADVRIRGR